MHTESPIRPLIGDEVTVDMPTICAVDAPRHALVVRYQAVLATWRLCAVSLSRRRHAAYGRTDELCEEVRNGG